MESNVQDIWLKILDRFTTAADTGELLICMQAVSLFIKGRLFSLPVCHGVGEERQQLYSVFQKQ